MGTRFRPSGRRIVPESFGMVRRAAQTANKGATANVGSGAGGVAPGLYTLTNEGIRSAVFRVQRKFLP
jgi:hypothetical protein